MELLQNTSPLIELYTSLPEPNRFTLFDIGCSGGIDPVFLRLGKGFRALGIDASVDEIERLRNESSGSRVQYIDGLVGLPAEHPFLKSLENSPYWHNNVFPRTSAKCTADMRAARNSDQTHAEKMKSNIWHKTKLSDNRITLIEAMEGQNLADIDLLKIDIDGPDFVALQILDGRFLDFGILAVVMEVNFYGGHHATDHTFHNTDRFMRKNGFDLFGLTTRPYSMAALPSRFQYDVPAQTFGGRPIQGDALYVRDVCSTGYSENLDPGKLVNLLLIYSLFGLPDCAGEVILRYRDILSSRIDTNIWLDALTRQSLELQGISSNFAPNYSILMEKYHRDSPDFYGPGSRFNEIEKQCNKSPISVWRRLGLKLGLTKNLPFE